MLEQTVTTPTHQDSQLPDFPAKLGDSPLIQILSELTEKKLTHYGIKSGKQGDLFRKFYYCDNILEILPFYEHYSDTIQRHLVDINKVPEFGADDFIPIMIIPIHHYVRSIKQLHRLLLIIKLLEGIYASDGDRLYPAITLRGALCSRFGHEFIAQQEAKYDPIQFISLLRPLLRIHLYCEYQFSYESDDQRYISILNKVLPEKDDFYQLLQLQLKETELPFITDNTHLCLVNSIKYYRDELFCYYLLNALMQKPADGMDQHIKMLMNIQDSSGQTFLDYVEQFQFKRIMKSLRDNQLIDVHTDSSIIADKVKTPKKFRLRARSTSKRRSVRTLLRPREQSPFPQRVGIDGQEVLIPIKCAAPAQYALKQKIALMVQKLLTERIYDAIEDSNIELPSHIFRTRNISKHQINCLFKLDYMLSVTHEIDLLLLPIRLYFSYDLKLQPGATLKDYCDHLDPLSRYLLELYQQFRSANMPSIAHIITNIHSSADHQSVEIAFRMWNATKRTESSTDKAHFKKTATLRSAKKLMQRVTFLMAHQQFPIPFLKRARTLLIMSSKPSKERTRSIFGNRVKDSYRNQMPTEDFNYTETPAIGHDELWNHIETNPILGFSDDFHSLCLCELMRYDAHSGKKVKDGKRSSHHWYKDMNKHPSKEKRTALQQLYASIIMRAPIEYICYNILKLLLSDRRFASKPHGYRFVRLLEKGLQLLGLEKMGNYYTSASTISSQDQLRIHLIIGWYFFIHPEIYNYRPSPDQLALACIPYDNSEHEQTWLHIFQLRSLFDHDITSRAIIPLLQKMATIEDSEDIQRINSITSSIEIDADSQAGSSLLYNSINNEIKDKNIALVNYTASRKRNSECVKLLALLQIKLSYCPIDEEIAFILCKLLHTHAKELQLADPSHVLYQTLDANYRQRGLLRSFDERIDCSRQLHFRYQTTPEDFYHTLLEHYFFIIDDKILALDNPNLTAFAEAHMKEWCEVEIVDDRITLHAHGAPYPFLNITAITDNSIEVSYSPQQMGKYAETIKSMMQALVTIYSLSNDLPCEDIEHYCSSHHLPLQSPVSAETDDTCTKKPPF